MPLWAWWTTACVFFAAGIVLAAIGLFCDRSKSRRCLRCGYDMTGVPGLACPECGRAARSEMGLVGTRRRWSRVWAGLLAAAVGLGVGTHLQVNSLEGGWWRAAPTSVLLRRLERTDSRDLQWAIWTRVASGDPRQMIVDPESLSERRWAEVAAICGRLIADPDRSPRTRHWASVTLGRMIPDAGLVDPILEELLSSTDEEVRCGATSCVYTYYRHHGELAAQWFDELVALACLSNGSASSRSAAGILALPSPPHVGELRKIMEVVRNRDDAAAAFNEIAGSLAAGTSLHAVPPFNSIEPIQAHLDLLQELHAFGPEAAAAAEAAMALLRQWGFIADDAEELD